MTGDSEFAIVTVGGGSLWSIVELEGREGESEEGEENNWLEHVKY